MDRRDDEDRIPLRLQGAGPGAALPYVVELWDLTRGEPERVLGRAASLGLANAVFAAARSEYAGRKLVLKRSDKVLAESA